MDESGQCLSPKETGIAEFEAAIDRTEPCSGCSAALRLPYVLCQECADRVCICLSCFSRGVEVRSHQNDHAYQIVHLNFSVLEDSWTAEEEVKLIKALASAGFGNWPEVAQQVQSKDAKECEQHYLHAYINSPLPPMPRIEPPATVGLASAGGYTNGYPRPSLSDVDIPDFMPCRGDFATEHLNDAEMVICDVEFDTNDCDLSTALKLAAVDIYQKVLKQRESRKRLIRDHGLINLSLHQNHDREITRQLGSAPAALRPYMRLQTAEQHQQLLHGLCYELFLRSEIRRLQEFRTHGIRSRRGARTYESLKQQRQEDGSNPQMAEELARAVELTHSCQRDLDASPSLAKRQPTAVDFLELTGADRLTPAERELCSSLRLRPHVYENYRTIVTQEMERNGRLRLADARRLLPIDVNKTRKLYDFFVDACLVIPA